MKKILIVEDEPSLLKALLEGLERKGYELLIARNGEEGLNMALQNKPDLILLDLILPRMDGITLLNKLREDDWGKDVNVIILTNLTDDKKLDIARDQGVHDYLVKSDWSIKDVIQRIEKKLS